jgi:acyl-CoA hydrolase
MSSITLRFLVEPCDIGPGGRVHGGTVMKWIGEAGYACATRWAGRNCHTVYTSSVRYRRSIKPDSLIEVQARLAFTGDTNMNIAVEVRSGDLVSGKLEPVTECMTVYIALDEDGRPMTVDNWTPETPGEMALAKSARAQFENTTPAPLE